MYYRCTNPAYELLIALRAMIREYSGGCAKSCGAARRRHLTMAKCLRSPPPPRMPKPMYYRCTNPASAYSFSRAPILSSRVAFSNRFVSIRRKKVPSAVLPRELFCLFRNQADDPLFHSNVLLSGWHCEYSKISIPAFARVVNHPKVGDGMYRS